jgi:hypothetical protein
MFVVLRQMARPASPARGLGLAYANALADSRTAMLAVTGGAGVGLLPGPAAYAGMPRTLRSAVHARQSVPDTLVTPLLLLAVFTRALD